MKRMLRNAKRALDQALGTVSDEWYWRLRHIFGKKGWAESYLSPESLESKERKKFIEMLAAHGPIASALEIGCASGPNLVLLARAFPEAKLYGTDISGHAIAYGKRWLAEHNMPNITLETKRAEDLSGFADKSIDIIFTNAALFYVGPDKIGQAVHEMLRVAKKAIVLLEWNTEEAESLYADHWAHNWKKLFADAGKDTVRLTKMEPDPWGVFGYYIEVPIT